MTRGHAIAKRAQDREANVAEEKARQRLDDARPERLLAGGLLVDRARAARERERHEHRREEEDPRRLRRRGHDATDPAFPAHLRADGDRARQIVDGEPAPEAGVRRIEADQQRGGTERDHRDDAEEEHHGDRDALLVTVRADDRGDRVHGGGAADHRAAGQEIDERPAHPEPHADDVGDEERARKRARRDPEDHRHLAATEEARLHLHPHEDDGQTEDPLADVAEAGRVAIGLALLAETAEAEHGCQRRVDDHRADEQGKHDVRDERRGRQRVRHRDGDAGDDQREHEARGIGTGREPLRSHGALPYHEEGCP